MLTFEEKLQIIESFPQLQRKDVSLKRVNFHYEESIFEKKVVVHHLHPNGNGFVFVGNLSNYDEDMDDKGFVNIRNFSAEELRKVVKESIHSLSSRSDIVLENAIVGENDEERWVNNEGQTLLLVFEDEWWNVYAGLNLEAAFGSYREVEEYMAEEGFHLE